MTPSPPTGSNYGSTKLLVDLVTNTLDPGYAAAAERRGPAPQRRWFDRPAVAVGCALVGFILVIAYDHTHRGAPGAAKVHDRLVTRVRAAQKQDADLARQVQRLTAELNAVRDQAVPSALAREVDRDQTAAGETAVTGPGLTVVLKEPPPTTPKAGAGRVGTVPIAATNILTDRDVRSVVNELWADGAEAISVNDIRITPVSAIRFAGQAVLVDFQPITSPYTVRAIGNANGLATGFASSAVASRYQTLSSADGIGFSFTESDHLSLPASAPVTPRYAQVATPSASPSPPRPATSGTRR